MNRQAPLGWFGIVRLGLVQTSLGAIVVLTTSTLNRIMVVEIALPAIVPGLLIALHYSLQVLRPRMGFGSDMGGRRVPWIIGGMAVLSLGGILAALATVWMMTNPVAGIALAVVAFGFIGLGVGASGTTLLVLLAKRTDEHRKPAAATIVWVMMIAGFIATAATVGSLLDPFSGERLIIVASCVSLAALLITVVAVWNIEGQPSDYTHAQHERAVQTTSFKSALKEVWSEPESRRFAVFIFVSMIAYSAQDLILEPFAGIVFGYTPGESTKLSGLQNSGVLCGMVLVAVAGTAIGGRWFGSMRMWTLLGCVGSAVALFSLTIAGLAGPSSPLRVLVFLLGFANGVYAVAAIGSMMGLVSKGAQAREGTRMGLWGASQAIAFGMGGIVGTLASDITRLLLGSPGIAYGVVFAAEGLLFLLAAWIALRVHFSSSNRQTSAVMAPNFANAKAGQLQ